jgi:MerR family transcriptional regulator, copper efflux regulator
LAVLGDRQMIVGMTSGSVMTIGRLSRRTGVPVKVLREYEDMGLIYTVGRSAGNYRLFDEDALWCVGVVSGLRTLGLTLSEIRELASNYLGHTGEPVGPRLAGVLQVVRVRTGRRIAELQELLGRLDEFEIAAVAELAGRADFRTQDPRFRRDRLDSAPGGRP